MYSKEGKLSGLEIASQINENIDVSFETTEQGVIGAQKLANSLSGTSSEILNAGQVGKITGVTLGVVSVGLTVVDGLTNEKGWQNHHTADAIIGTTEIGLGLFEATSPVGWAFGLCMFVGNLISEHYTGKTITENLFDN